MKLFATFFGPPDIDRLERQGKVKRLIKALRHPEGSIRARAAEALGRAWAWSGPFFDDKLRFREGSRREIEAALRDAVNDGDPAVSDTAKEALDLIWVGSQQEVIRKWERSDFRRYEEAAAAVQRLGQVHHPRVVSKVIDICTKLALTKTKGVSSGEYEPLVAAVKVLETIGCRPEYSEEAINALTRIAHSRRHPAYNPMVRQEAMKALARLAGEASIGTLEYVLAEEEFNTDQVIALGILCEMSGGAAVNALVKALDRGRYNEWLGGLVSSCERCRAASALGRIGDGRAVGPLISALARSRQPCRDCSSRLAAALASITGEDFGEDASAWARWWETRRGTEA